METFAKFFARFPVLVYQCFDRIVIQGYMPLLHASRTDRASFPRLAWSISNYAAGAGKANSEVSGKPQNPHAEGRERGEQGEVRPCLFSDGPNPGSVIAVVKHWVGYGAQKDGWDSHNYYGRFATFPGSNFEFHITPYLGAFGAQVGGIMPVYSVLLGITIDGKPLEQVAGGFNAQLLQDLLRKKYGFKGVVVSDWGITNDCQEHCRTRSGSSASTPPQ